MESPELLPYLVQEHETCHLPLPRKHSRHQARIKHALQDTRDYFNHSFEHFRWYPVRPRHLAIFHGLDGLDHLVLAEQRHFLPGYRLYRVFPDLLLREESTDNPFG